MDDLVDEPGIAVGVLCTVRGFRALAGVLASHLTLLLTDGHVLILDSTVLVGGWTDRFGGTLAVQLATDWTLASIDVLVREDLLAKSGIFLVSWNRGTFGRGRTVAFMGALDRTGQAADVFVLVDRHAEIFIPGFCLHRRAFGFGWTVTNLITLNGTGLPKYALVLVHGFTQIVIFLVFLTFRQRWTGALHITSNGALPVMNHLVLVDGMTEGAIRLVFLQGRTEWWGWTVTESLACDWTGQVANLFIREPWCTEMLVFVQDFRTGRRGGAEAFGHTPHRATISVDTRVQVFWFTV